MNVAFRANMLLLVMLLTLLVSIMPVSAGNGAVGVQAGDWAKYGEISVKYESDPPVPASQSVVDLNNTEWVKIEVQSVSGTSITAVQTNHFKNGTENTETHTWNITDLFWRRFNVFIIEANLSEDDPINVVPYRSSPWPEPSLALTDTVSRRYAGAIREVNRMNDTFSKGKYAASDVDAYWDKMTGVLCELGETEFIGIPPLDWITNTTTRMKIIATNLWQPTPFWTEPLFWVIIGVIIVAVTASGILIWQRRKTLRAPNSSL